MAYYEVLQAPIKFIDMPGIKERPILAINEVPFSKMRSTEAIDAIKITSKEPREGKYVEHKIILWKLAGLDVPSTIRLSTVYSKIPKSAVKYQRGNLQKPDILRLQVLIRKYADKMGIYD